MPGTVIKKRLGCEETQGILRNHGSKKRKGQQISAKAGKLTGGLWAHRSERSGQRLAGVREGPMM